MFIVDAFISAGIATFVVAVIVILLLVSGEQARTIKNQKRMIKHFGALASKEKQLKF